MSKRVDSSVNPPWYVNVEFNTKRAGRLPVETGAWVDFSGVTLPSGGYSEKKRKRMPDLITRWEIVLVSDVVKTAIEDLEPGIHQFVPFELRNGKRGEPTETPYFLLNIAQQACSIDIENSSIKDFFELNGEILNVKIPLPSGEWSENPKRFVMKRQLNENLHLWREKWDMHCFYMSDTLHDLCRKRGAKGLEIRNEFEDL